MAAIRKYDDKETQADTLKYPFHAGRRHDSLMLSELGEVRLGQPGFFDLDGAIDACRRAAIRW